MSTIITNYYEIPNGEVTSANDYIVETGGEMYVLDGGTLTNSIAQNSGTIWLDTGATGQNIAATLDGEAWVYCPVDSMTADSGGYIYIDAGGLVNSAEIQSGGRCVVYTGADANEFNVSGGSMLLYGCSASNAVVSENGALVLQYSTALAADTTILTGGLVRVVSTGSAQGTTVSGGVLEVLEGEVVDTVVSGGSMRVAENNMVYNTTIEDGAVTISSSYTDGVTMNGGTLNAEYSSVENVQINGGAASFTGSYIFNIEVGTGASIALDSDSILSGKVVLADGASITVNGGSVEFDTAYTTSTDAQVVGFSGLTGNAVYTLFASGAADGTYLLATDAATFDSGIAFEGAVLTSGSPVFSGNQLYSLGLSDNNDLTLTVSALDLTFFSGAFDGSNVMLARDVEDDLKIYDLNGDVWSTWPVSEEICGTGDFNGDGMDDLLTLNSDGYVTGEMSNGNGTFTPQVLNFLETGWSILGTGDFNADGADDILVANPDAAAAGVGLFGYWSGGTDWQFLGGYTSDWEIISTGDFDGDGKCDTLWRNSFVGGDSLTYNAYCTSITDAADGWRVVSVTGQDDWAFLCTGDFNGDGMDDIAMINGDAYVGIWGVNNGTFESWTLASWDNLTNWTCVNAGDFNGDGTDDMMWYNPTNNYYCCWQMDNMEIGSKQIFTTIA